MYHNAKDCAPPMRTPRQALPIHYPLAGMFGLAVCFFLGGPVFAQDSGAGQKAETGRPQVSLVVKTTTDLSEAADLISEFTKLNPGVMTVTGTSTYGGPTTITGGSIAESFTTVGGTNLLPANGLVLNGGGLTLTGFAAGANSQTINHRQAAKRQRGEH